jgi:MOSC domain-containing protein YiiM
MTQSATIHSLVYQPTPSQHEPPYHYNRVPTSEVRLIAGHGIEGDYKAGHNPKRHLNIMTREHQDDLASEGYKTNPGELGEQITITGFMIEDLEPGTVVRLGDSAMIRINEKRTGCDWLEQVQGRETRETAKGRLGVMASVIEGGTVRVGDTVRVLQPAQ